MREPRREAQEALGGSFRNLFLMCVGREEFAEKGFKRLLRLPPPFERDHGPCSAPRERSRCLPSFPPVATATRVVGSSRIGRTPRSAAMTALDLTTNASSKRPVAARRAQIGG